MGCVSVCNAAVLWLIAWTDRVVFWHEVATAGSYRVLDGGSDPPTETVTYPGVKASVHRMGKITICTRGVEKVRRLTVHQKICSSYFFTFQRSLLQLKCTWSNIFPKSWFRCGRIVDLALPDSQRKGETLDQVHLSCRKICCKVTEYDIHVFWLTASVYKFFERPSLLSLDWDWSFEKWWTKVNRNRYMSFN